MHFTGNAHGKHGQLFGVEIKKTIGAEIPLWRQVKAVVEVHAGCNACFIPTIIRSQRTVKRQGER